MTQEPDDPIRPDPDAPDAQPPVEGEVLEPQADATQAGPADAAAGEPPAEGPGDPQALYERLQRVTADFMNFQRRAQKKEAQAREMANDALLKDLLGVLDDMERALAAARANHPADDPLLTGMQMVHDNLVATLGRYGLEAIAAENQPFDPELHQAVQQVPAPDHPPQTVVQELQKGYRLKQRTLRPSMVVVSAAAGGAPEE